MNFILAGLLPVVSLASCNSAETEIVSNVIFDQITDCRPSDIDSWPGVVYDFRDGTGVFVQALDKISSVPHIDLSNGDKTFVVAFDKQDFLTFETQAGMPSDKYTLTADVVGENMPRVWCGSNECDDPSSGINIDLRPVTSQMTVTLANLPEDFKKATIDFGNVMSDTFCPATGECSAVRTSGFSASLDKTPLVFNLFPMTDLTEPYKVTVNFELADRSFSLTPVLEKRVAAGTIADLVFDLASLNQPLSAVSMTYTLKDMVTGKSTKQKSSLSALSDEDKEIVDLNRHYEVFVRHGESWKPVRVFDALCSDAAKHGSIWNDWGNDKKLRDTMSYCIFEHPFDGPVSVRVRKKDKEFSDAAIRPTLWNIPVRNCGNGVIEFELTSYDRRKVSVEFDGDRQHNLFLIPNRPDPDKPDPSDPNVIYFGPGEHERSKVVVSSGQTLYLDYGAVLYSTIDVVGDNCTVAGHGILSGDKLRHWGGSTYSNGDIILRCNSTRKRQASGLTVKDITIVNGPSWNLTVWNTDNVLIDGVNIIDWELNGDGIDFLCCRQAEIKNCLIRTYDDGITLKLRHNNAGDGPYNDMCDVKVHDNLIWNDYARGIVVGPEAGNTTIGTGYIHDIDIYNCTFLQHKRGHTNDDLRACLAIGQMSSPVNGTPTPIKNIKARDLVFDNISRSGRNVWIYQYSSPDQCLIENVLMENFTILDGDSVMTPALSVTTNGSVIKGLAFKNIIFGGQKITGPGPELVVNGDVSYTIE